MAADQEIAAQRSAFEKDGFIIHDFGFEPVLIEACAAATRPLAGRALRVQNLWRKNEAVKQLGAHPRVLSFLKSLYGREAFPFQTLNFLKGTQQAAHADTIHFSSDPAHSMCGVWVALEDITEDNGPLFYYPGSHDLPVADMAMIGKKAGGDVVAYFAQQAAKYPCKTALIKKGEAVIWAANVLHGGSAIKDPNATRLSQVTHYFFEDCVYTTPINLTEKKRRYMRHPYDFARQRFVWGRKDGRRVWPGLSSFMAEHINNLRKHTPEA